MAEEVGNVHSDRISITNNLIRNGGNSVTGQFIAGVWCENTNQALIANNFISDNRNDPPNQAFSRGIQVYPTPDSGTGSQYSFTIADNVVEGCYIGIGIAGEVPNASYQISGGTVRDFDLNGISVYQVGGVVAVNGVHFGAPLTTDDPDLEGPGAGLVVIDQNNMAGRMLKDISVIGCSREPEIMYAHGAAADFNVYSGGASVLNNVKLASLAGTWKAAMAEWAVSVEVYDSKLAAGSMFLAGRYDGEQWTPTTPTGPCVVGDIRLGLPRFRGQVSVRSSDDRLTSFELNW